MWRDAVTEKSWRLLQRLRSDSRFILIGGWAVYLYTNALKSRDVDIIVDFPTLEMLNVRYNLSKNMRLKKYEFAIDGIEVDTYVPFFSDLGVPVEEIQGNTVEIAAFTVPRAEYLLATKQKAETSRRGSDKGLKDRIDILALLLRANIDVQKYAALLARHGLSDYLKELEGLVVSSKNEMKMLGITDARKARLLKNELLRKMRAARQTRH